MIRDKQIKRADRGKRHSGFSAVGIISLLRKINFVELSEEGGPLNKLTGQIWRKKKKNQRKKVLWFLSHKKLNLKLNSLLSKQPINIHRFFFQLLATFVKSRLHHEITHTDYFTRDMDGSIRTLGVTWLIKWILWINLKWNIRLTFLYVNSDNMEPKKINFNKSGKF